MNLATNARDAMPRGGRFTISAARTVLDEEYVRAKGQGTPGPYARLVVRDTGAGMDEETQARMFDPFFTTKEPGKGTGLGLATVYGIVSQNGGHIDVSSGIGEGTTLRIHLPLVDARPVPDRPAGPTQAIRGGQETILVAEDNAAVRQLNALVLRQHGYTVLEAADGEEAVEAFRQGGDGIHLAVLDVIMPRRNGREVLEVVRRTHPALKAIFTSGYSADLIQKQGVLEEGLNFLPKPSTPQALLRKVREVLDR
jgi:CheY-like chemotaxis protein